MSTWSSSRHQALKAQTTRESKARAKGRREDGCIVLLCSVIECTSSVGVGAMITTRWMKMALCGHSMPICMSGPAWLLPMGRRDQHRGRDTLQWRVEKGVDRIPNNGIFAKMLFGIPQWLPT